MLKYQTYDEYKDSGEPWIGCVPEHWVPIKLKHLFYEKKHTPNLALGCGSISFGEVIEKNDERVAEATKASYQEVLEGEYLINPLNLNYDLKSLRIALSKINVVVSAGYLVIKEKIEINKNYFKYLLHRFDIDHMKLMGSGVRQTINFGHIANSLLVKPPLDEQSAIANFLDQKTKEIDEAIAKKEKLIELLKEQKSILINQAVTKGLNPNASMKDSGIEWVGQIPAHWKLKKVKHISILSPSKSISNAKRNDELVTFLPMENIGTDGNLIQDNKQKSKDVYDGFTFFGKNDVVIAKITPCFENGKGAWLDKLETEFGFGTTELHVLRAKKEIFGGFLFLFLNRIDFRILGEKFMTGTAGQKRIPSDFIREFPIGIPPIEEQYCINNYCNDVKSHFTQLEKSEVEGISKLKEFKQTLIAHAVTGKIKI